MLTGKLINLSLLILVVGQAIAQPRSLQAIKVSSPPKIDGVLDDPAWQKPLPATDFIQNFPSFGAPASQKTEVRVVYDNDAIYIGAHLYDNPALIRRQITARDDELQKDLDYFSVFLDTYDDEQNGFQFLVTSSNVQSDARLGPNLATATDYGDKTWDAVWESQVSIVSDGWIVEMRIPYLSIRFAKKNTQDWGIQFLRTIRRNNETSFWNPVDPSVNGFVNQFGRLKDLAEINPPLRLNFSPYVSTGLRSTALGDTYKNEWLKNGGMDVKYGINESFTLDATLVPDFEQVISDNVVNNLTPYEVKFDDYRPFFTEGTEIFNKSGLFYSRRIAGIPTGYQQVIKDAMADPNIEIIKNPARTQLINGVKFSGRTRDKSGIGVFNAITAPMYAVIRDRTTGFSKKVLTEPLANYNILVFDQALRGQSYITFTNTNVIRDRSGRDANVSGIDFSLFDKSNTYNVRGYGHYSRVMMDNPYGGYNTSLRVGKVSGKIQYYLQNVIRSDKYDPTDLGYQQTANLNTNTGSIGYYQFTPTRSFLNYSYVLRTDYRRLYRPNRFSDLTVSLTGTWTLRNFWETNLAIGYLPDQHDYFVLDTPYVKYARRPAYGYVNLFGNTDVRKKFLFTYNIYLSDFFNSSNKSYHILEGDARYRFGNKFSIDLYHRHEAETDFIVSSGREVNGDPIIAFVDFKDVTTILSGTYNFTPRINITLRGRHNWSSVIYRRFANVDNKGEPLPRAFIGNKNQNINYLNIDAFFTWDFRLGSRLILGYKNSLGADELLDGSVKKNYFDNLGGTFSLRHNNELTLRFIYFLDYNQLRRKK
jgi:hypothetical protein